MRSSSTHSDWATPQSVPTEPRGGRGRTPEPPEPPGPRRPHGPAPTYGAEVVAVVPVVEVPVVEVRVVGVLVVEVDGAEDAAAVAAADGVNVATNGVRSGEGRTTGMVSTSRVNVGVPNCTVVDPVAWMFCTVPAESSPAQRVVPVVDEATWTQHEPVPVAVIW